MHGLRLLVFLFRRLMSVNAVKLTVVIPCYNEVSTIAELVEAVRASDYPDKELVLVDDCSTDGTREKLENELKSKLDKIIFHRTNQGKGAALRTGIKAATGDLIVIQDADLEYDPKDYIRLTEPIVNGQADVVYGSRFMGSGPHRVLYFWHRMGNGLLTLLSNMLTNLNLTDMETGYKAFRREIIQSVQIEEDRFGFEPEITAKMAQLSVRLYEVGISYHGRTYQQGKKIRWQDGLWAIVCIFKYNVGKRLPRQI